MPWNSSGSLVMENAHDAYAALYTSGKNHLVIQNSGTLSIGRTTPDGNASVSINGAVSIAGSITGANKFYGDGSGLTGVVASGTGVIIQEEGSTIGTASTINFVGTSVTATFNSGTATISLTDNVGTAGTGALAGIDTTGQSVFNNINASGIVTSLGGFSGNITGTAGTFTTVSAAGTISATMLYGCLLYTSPSPRDRQKSRMPSSA